MIAPPKILLSGAEVYPIVEGGKGIGLSNGQTSGAFAAAGAVGTLSGVCPPAINRLGEYIPHLFKGRNRQQRSKEIIQFSIEGTIREVKKAFEVSGGKGRIHLNVLWGVAGAETIITEVLKATQGMVHGVTCGAGMPYRLADIAQEFKVYYYPIVSSVRAFSALWGRSYQHVSQWLGGIVYEDPWKAGGHNGLSNKDNPAEAGDPYPRVKAIRDFLHTIKLPEIPIIMAGGVWNLQPFAGWFNNPEIGPVAFQLGTRPLLTRESPVAHAWQNKLTHLQEGDVALNRFSSTGFYSSALQNSFLRELQERSNRQIEYREDPEKEFISPMLYHPRKPAVFIRFSDLFRVMQWMEQGFINGLTTPDQTLIFVIPEKAREIRQDQKDCKGCLVACKFSSWAASEEHHYTTGLKADPRSFCIQKTLQNMVCTGDAEHELLFCGHNAHRFASDPLYAHQHLPTIQELVNKVLAGE